MSVPKNLSDHNALPVKPPVPITPEPHASPGPARTELGRRLREIRERIVASGQPLLDWDGLDREIQRRRGERDMEDRA